MHKHQSILLTIFNFLLIIIIGISTLMSLVALYSIHLTLFKLEFSFSPEALNFYIASVASYSSLFAGTFVATAAYVGLLRLKVANEANLDKIKIDRYSDWKTVLDIRFTETEESDPKIKREFIRKRYTLFNQLFDLNFRIEDKEQLTLLYNKTFKSLSSFLEQTNKKQVEYGGIYRDERYAYAFDSFRFLLLGCLDEYYPTIEEDLKTLYLADLGSRHIDKGTFDIIHSPNILD